MHLLRKLPLFHLQGRIQHRERQGVKGSSSYNIAHPHWAIRIFQEALCVAFHQILDILARDSRGLNAMTDDRVN